MVVMAAVADTRVEGMKADVLEMMGLVRQSIDEAVRSLDDRDVDLASNVIQRDAKVDEMEKRIESTCLELLAGGIKGKTWRAVVASFKMISDLERIGDYSVGVASVTLAVANKPLTPSALNIIKMAQVAVHMMKLCMDAYGGEAGIDIEEVFGEDKSIDRLYSDTFAGAVTAILDEPNTATNAIYTTVAARAMERIGDHITNIAERIVYIETGRMVRRSEPMHVPEFP
jgi:phosphate transport system protein